MTEREQSLELSGVTEFVDKMNRLYAKELSTEEILANNERATALAQEFKATHEDYNDYTLYHVLIGSQHTDRPKFDTEDGELTQIIRSL